MKNAYALPFIFYVYFMEVDMKEKTKAILITTPIVLLLILNVIGINIVFKSIDICSKDNVAYSLVKTTSFATGIPESKVAKYYASCAEDDIDIYDGVKGCCDEYGVVITDDEIMSIITISDMLQKKEK